MAPARLGALPAESKHLPALDSNVQRETGRLENWSHEMKTAIYQGREVSGEDGVDIRDASPTRPEFRCPECALPVKVMRAGGNQRAHFEHDDRNDHCTLVHHPR